MTTLALVRALAESSRSSLATLPTPLEDAGRLPSGRRLWVKRDDLTGLGMGGNKARKLEYLCGEAVAAGADLLVTVGAAQSNHARMTAAAGARLGLETHLVLGGRPVAPAGNQLLSALVGAQFHHPGTDDWDELEADMAIRIDGWTNEGRHPFAMPIGGSTPIGARGFVGGWLEVQRQIEANQAAVGAIVHSSSSGGTHAGLLAGRAVTGGPDILAVGVAKTGGDLAAIARELADGCLASLGRSERVAGGDVHVDGDHQGSGYAVPTAEADAALRWAARRGGWFLDRTYTAKAMAGLLARDAADQLPPGDVVFWHTGGHPALFGPDGAPGP